MNSIKDELASTGEIDRRFESEINGAAPAQGIVIPRDPGIAEWEHARIIIHRVVIRELLHSKNPDSANMLMLYCFYYECGRYQKTNQPWAVDKFCIKGLGWRKDKFHRYIRWRQ